MNLIRRQIYNPLALAVTFFVLLIILFGVLWILVPPPPKSIEMATGFPTGLYTSLESGLRRRYLAKVWILRFAQLVEH